MITYENFLRKFFSTCSQPQSFREAQNSLNVYLNIYLQGWANERVVGKYQDGRVLMILPSDPKPWWVKVTKIIGIVDQELGFPEAVVSALHRKTVNYITIELSRPL